MQTSGRINQSMPQAARLREMVATLSDVLTRTSASVEALRERADAAAGALADGSMDDIHSVMVAMKEANEALQLTIQVRNQLLEAYRELARIRV